MKQRIVILVRFVRKYRWQSIVIALLLLCAGLVIFVFMGRQLPSTVWLPTSAPEDAALYLPITSDVVKTKYGKAVRYFDREKWQTIYEFRANDSLRANTCPNIIDLETLSPSGCDKLGTFDDQPVYVINRSLPSGRTEYFVRLHDTFVFISGRGDGGRSMQFVNSFIKMKRGNAESALAANNKRVEVLLAKIRAQEAAVDRINRASYKKLTFSPALPKDPPPGWSLTSDRFAKQDHKLELHGTDADHPAMVEAAYKNNKDYISVFVIKLSDASVGTTCGPTPTQGMVDLPCFAVPGYSNMYEHVESPYNTLIRFVYYPMGDSLVISQLNIAAKGNKVDWDAKLIADQDALTASAVSTPKESLPSSAFYRLFY